MSLAEVRIPSSAEKFSALVREAVKFVPVDEFLQLRFHKGRSCSDAEYTQMCDGADVIRKIAGEQGKTYKLGDEVRYSIDPRVIVARQIVINISTPTYLAARRKVLNTAISNTIGRRNEYELLGAVKAEKEKDKLKNRLADFTVTNQVIVAVKINLF